MRYRLSTVLAGLGLAILALPAPEARTAQQDHEDGVEVLARGPVHEAFAGPGATATQAAPVVNKEPPAPVEEMPPDQKPDGDDVEWISGYWAWDDESSDFLWISGFWRDVPPNRDWVPGNWEKVRDGWQWVAGFWSSEEQKEAEYLPAPPESLERGPSAPAPDADSNYVPGCWVWAQTRYAWRPGFWVAHRPNWVYVPARYVWAPAGCVFVEGYWDHPIHDRGLLFAPVRIDRRVVRRVAYVPRQVVNHDFLLTSLFVRPANRHYYFGDYFEQKYTKAGFVPWVDYRVTRTTYDQNLVYYRREHRSERWEKGLRDLYAARFSGDVARPPRTLVEQTKVIQNVTAKKIENRTVTQNINVTNVQNVTVLAPITKVQNTRVTALASLAGTDTSKVESRRVVKLQTVNKEEQTRVQKSVVQTREVTKKRQEMHARVIRESKPQQANQPQKPVKVELPRMAARPKQAESRPERKKAPPAPQAPKVEPRPTGKPETPPNVKPADRPKDPPKVVRPEEKPRDPPKVAPPTRPQPNVKPADRPKDPPKVRPEERPKDPPRAAPPTRPQTPPPARNPVTPRPTRPAGVPPQS